MLAAAVDVEFDGVEAGAGGDVEGLGACGAEGAVGGAFGNVDDAEGFALFVDDVDAFGGDVEVAEGVAGEGVAGEGVAAFVEVVVSERSDPWLETLLSDYNAVMVGSDIKTLSAVERLRAMELLWRSFAGSGHEIPSSEWHGDVLSSRLAKVEAGEGHFLTIEELESRLSLKQG
jgi:putative addiction module component (TIGR02574 family)